MIKIFIIALSLMAFSSVFSAEKSITLNQDWYCSNTNVQQYYQFQNNSNQPVSVLTRHLFNVKSNLQTPLIVETHAPSKTYVNSFINNKLNVMQLSAMGGGNLCAIIFNCACKERCAITVTTVGLICTIDGEGTKDSPYIIGFGSST